MMVSNTYYKSVLFWLVITLSMSSAQLYAQSSSSLMRGLYGDWQVKSDMRRRQIESVFSFSRDTVGNLTGDWITFWQASKLQDIKYEGGQLSFVHVSRNRDGQSTTSIFTGTIKEDKLTGVISDDNGEHRCEGLRIPRMPLAVGIWEMSFKKGVQEFTKTLLITADKQGQLDVHWKSEGNEPKITDVEYDQGRLTFKTANRNPERRSEPVFEASFEGNTLSAVMKSELGDVTGEGKRIGAALIGTWDLEVTSEQSPRTRKQRLMINPDMSGFYGPVPIKKVNLESDEVSFKSVLESGERKFEMEFKGKLLDSKLTGELTTSFGNHKITGTKVVNTEDRPYNMPLFQALRNKDSDKVKLLLNQGADLNDKDPSWGYGYTPLHWAVMMDSMELTKLILEAGATVNVKGNAGETPLDVAAYRSSPTIGKLLLAKGAEVSSLHAAALIGDLEKAKAFIGKDIDVNQEKGGCAALHCAVSGGHREIVELLISKGADLNMKHWRGWTPLHMAVRGSHLDIVQLLLESGADINVRATAGLTALGLAQRAGNDEIINLLQKHGVQE